jgi:hypothetical protein
MEAPTATPPLLFSNFCYFPRLAMLPALPAGNKSRLLAVESGREFIVMFPPGRRTRQKTGEGLPCLCLSCVTFAYWDGWRPLDASVRPAGPPGRHGGVPVRGHAEANADVRGCWPPAAASAGWNIQARAGCGGKRFVSRRTSVCNLFFSGVAIQGW